MEELLTGELPDQEDEVAARASAFVLQLWTSSEERQSRPDPSEMARTAQRTWRAWLRLSCSGPSCARGGSLGTIEDGLIAGYADALAFREGRVEVAIDWKSDISFTPATLAGYIEQLKRYLSVTGADRGAVVFMSLGEITWAEPDPREANANASNFTNLSNLTNLHLLPKLRGTGDLTGRARPHVSWWCGRTTC